MPKTRVGLKRSPAPSPPMCEPCTAPPPIIAPSRCRLSPHSCGRPGYTECVGGAYTYGAGDSGRTTCVGGGGWYTTTGGCLACGGGGAYVTDGGFCPPCSSDSWSSG